MATKTKITAKNKAKPSRKSSSQKKTSKIATGRPRKQRATADKEKKAVKQSGDSVEVLAEKKKAFLDTAKSNLGFISATCKSIGIAPNTFYKWMAEDPEFKAAYDEVYEDRREFVESSLYKQIKAGNTTATIFALKSKFGWVEKQQLDIKADVNHKILSFDPLSDNSGNGKKDE